MTFKSAQKSAKNSSFPKKSAQNSTFKSTICSSDPICLQGNKFDNRTLMPICLPKNKGYPRSKAFYDNISSPYRFRDTQRSATAVGMGLSAQRYVITGTTRHLQGHICALPELKSWNLIDGYSIVWKYDSPLNSEGAPVTQMATVQKCSCNVQLSGSEILTRQRMNMVIGR